MSIFGQWARAASSFLWRLLYGQASSPGSAPAAAPDAAAVDAITNGVVTEDPSYVPFVERWPIPGEWERHRYPNWPPSRFEIPKTKPHPGMVYYITRGELIAPAASTIVELLPSGDAVLKRIKEEPFHPDREEVERKAMVQEAAIYRLLHEKRPGAPVPRLIDFVEQEYCLTLEYMSNGCLEDYMNQHPQSEDISIETRQRWALQAAEGLEALHSIEVIHSDVAPRNYAIDAQLNLRIIDFAGGFFFDDPKPMYSYPGARYQPTSNRYRRKPVEADDVFGLASVIYLIFSGREPYSEIDEDQVSDLFMKKEFPDTSFMLSLYSSVVQDCWHGRMASARAVVEALREATDDETHV